MLTLFFWIVCLVLVLVLFSVSSFVRYQQLQARVDARPLDQLNISSETYAWYMIGLDVLVAITHIVIAAVIFLRKPDDRMAVFVSLTLIINGSILPLTELAGASSISPALIWIVRLFIYLGMVSSIVLLYVFPDGKFVPRFTIYLSLAWGILMLVGIYSRSAGRGFDGWSATLQFLIVLVFAATGVYAQVYRYQKVSRPIQRQQTKWAILGLAAACIGPMLVVANVFPDPSRLEVPNVMYQRVGSGFFTTSFIITLLSATMFKLASLLFPLTFAIAILRYRLWDIDILIRRTLVYGILTGTLLLVYLTSIVVTQAVLSLFTPSSTLSLIVSTLGTITLFNPLRKRIQSGIDRRFYRSRYDVEQIFDSFAKRLRNQVDPDQISSQLLDVLESTLQPHHASLWLRPGMGLWKVTKKNGDSADYTLISTVSGK